MPLVQVTMLQGRTADQKRKIAERITDLMVEEAGGKITHFDGGKFTLDSREVLATNGLILGEITHLFTEMFAGRGLEAIPTPAEFAARRAAAK